MRVLLILCFCWCAGSWRAAQGQVTSNADAPRTFRLVIDKQVAEELDRLADTLSGESVRCLIGVTVGDSAVVDLAWAPPIYASGATHVRYRSCPLATLVVWHNHLAPPDAAPEDACYLSGIDIEEAWQPHAPPFQMVQVNPEVLCWWSKVQVARATGQPVLWADAVQRHRATPAALARGARP